MFEIKIGDMSKAIGFVKACEKFNEDINYYYGRFIIDAKSLLGILSCSVEKPAKVEILTTNKTVIEEFEKAIEEWIIKEKEL